MRDKTIRFKKDVFNQYLKNVENPMIIQMEKGFVFVKLNRRRQGILVIDDFDKKKCHFVRNKKIGNLNFFKTRYCLK